MTYGHLTRGAKRHRIEPDEWPLRSASHVMANKRNEIHKRLEILEEEAKAFWQEVGMEFVKIIEKIPNNKRPIPESVNRLSMIQYKNGKATTWVYTGRLRSLGMRKTAL